MVQTIIATISTLQLKSSNILLQGRSTKIKTGQAIDDVTQTRGGGGAGGMPLRKMFEILMFCEYFGAILGPSTLQ